MALPLDEQSQAILTTVTDMRLNSPLPTPRSPAASFVSRESYSTAISSPETENIPTAKPAATHSVLAPQSLRKSISVDSFVHYGRDSLSTVVTRPNRGHTGSALEPPSGLVGLRRDLHQVNQSGRSRGDSISSVKSSQAEDSDTERSDAYSSPTDRYTHALKAENQPGLPLPSRTPTLSTTSSMSSIMSSTTSSSTQEAEPSLRSAPSLHAPPRPLVATGRTRSGSLGVYTQNTRRIHINTQLSSVSTF